jgi:hypothetical protein
VLFPLFRIWILHFIGKPHLTFSFVFHNVWTVLISSGARVCKLYRWVCDVRIVFSAGKACDVRDRPWYFKRTVRHRYMPPAQHLYNYGLVARGCKGKVGGFREGKIDVEALASYTPTPSVGWKTRSILMLCVPSTCHREKGAVPNIARQILLISPPK